jgi:hypothetical protein
MEERPQGKVTAVPVVPVFYLHTGEHPFCTKPGCPCLKNEAELRQVLQEVIDRKLHMIEVFNGNIQWRRRLNGS